MRFLFLLILYTTLFKENSCAQQNVIVSENKQTGFIEIRNGLLGIIVPSTSSFVKGKDCPAPVQSFIYSNGIVSDNTVNYLQSNISIETMKTTVVINTALKVVVQVVYGLSYEGKKYSYAFQAQVKKNEKSIVIEEDATAYISYSVKISDGLNPDKARYRGWEAVNAQNGYEPSGITYRSEDDRKFPLDATVDLNYQHAATYQRLVLWQPAGGEQNSGRYWQLFNSKANDNSNMLGFFQGQASRLIHARSVGPNLQIFAADKLNNEPGDAEIAENIELRGPDAVLFPRKRFQWAVYISTKKDIVSPEQTQPIAMELNRIAGLGAVISSYANKPVKLIPAFYNGAVYLAAEKVSALCNLVKNDHSLYNKLLQTEGGLQSLWDMWNSPQKGKETVAGLISYKKQLELNYVSGDGSYSRDKRYWLGARSFKFYAILTSCLFADKTIKINAGEKLQLEQLIGLMARILWDDNNVPLFDSASVNLGPENMVYQYRNNGRYFFALLLKDDPEFTNRAKQVATEVKNDIESAIAENGASFGTPHYTQATIEPLLFSILQLKHAGVVDFFKDDNKIKAFAKFYLSLLTPASCRFAGNRKLISFGDGSEESSAIFALLSTGFTDIDPDFSKELMAAFNYGPPRVSMHGPVRLAADITTTGDNRNIFPTTSSYIGYLTHYRSAINTTNETALWLLNGELLRDHRNDDAGETAIYALGAPLSLSGSSFYYPTVTDSRMRSVVVPEKFFPEWDGSNQPIAGRSLTTRTWPSSRLLEFASLGYSNSSTVLMKTADGNEWYRKLMMIDLPGNNPVIIYYDSVKGNAANIWSMPMMSEGPVSTPAGNILPEKRMNNNADLKQLPNGTPAKSMGNGLNRFAFTGQQWTTHSTGGINWYLFTLSDNNIDFSLADWATTWQNQQEQEEFLATNHRKYSEEQQIIRLKSTKPFFTMVLPFYKGKDIYSGGVEKTNTGNGFRLKLKEQEFVIYKTGYYMKDNKRFVMASWSAAARIEYNGYSIAGGYAEIENSGGKLTVHIHGNAGKRYVAIPFSIKALNPSKDVIIKSSAGSSSLLIDYAGGSLDLASGEKGYKEYTFTIQ